VTVSAIRTRPLSIPDLRSAVQGQVLAPGDPDYDRHRNAMSGEFDRHPAVIVRATDSADVIAAVAEARETGLDLAVRSGGHSGAGHSTTEGGILLDLAGLDSLDIDAAAQTAWAGSGLTAGAVTSATAEHGLAVPFGDTGSVGIGGLTTGGGIGYLVRKYGMTIDSLLAADVVTADGQVLRVDEQHHPDLFWAIRGGGGNFGVAIRFQFRLRELPGIVGGMLILPATAETIAGFVAAAEAAPEEVSGIANVMPAPPMPFLPEEHHGKLVIFSQLAYAGDDVEAGERALAPFRALATPLADLMKPMSYPELFPPEDDSYHPTAVARILFLDKVDRGVAETILEHLNAIDAPMRVAQLRVLGGAMSRVASDATAFAHRRIRIMAALAAFYEGPEDRVKKQAWLDRFFEAMHQGDEGAYVNFVNDEGPERVRAAYPGATWDRLAEIKGRYDPTNLFHVNHNIPPTT
jgi:FAD/FMN-containing dehydrogenase